MAKINLTNRHNQENLGAFASFGLLICMVVTVVGIKLWWFKHRLSFEQTSTQNGAAGGGTPPVIVPRRSKQPKYKRDKRYSQQIYDTGEVHGVFRKKSEDDLEIERPHQLPPVRVRHLSGSTTSLILPPPRTKRRDQVHSTAFEDLEIATPPLTTASSSDLTAIHESNTKISLTFEEFEKQFKLKEIKPEVPEAPVSKDVIEIPVPPLRLNRSSSAMVKPEKTTRYLKSSQSITIPEFHKVIERRPTGFSRPTEDLTKIDDYDEPKLFETFGERRPTGYIKYEEVDNDLQEVNQDQVSAKVNSISLESPKELPALEALRNERIIYNNDLNESPDVIYTEKYNFNIKTFKLSELQDVDYKDEDFMENSNFKIAGRKENSSVQFEELGTEIYSNNQEVLRNQKTNEFVDFPTSNEEEFEQELKTIGGSGASEFVKDSEERRPTEFVKEPEGEQEEIITEYRSVKERRPTEFVKSDQAEENQYVTDFSSVEDQRPKEYVRESTDPVESKLDLFAKGTATNSNNHPHIIKVHTTEYHTIKEHKPNKNPVTATISSVNSEIFDSSSLIEDFDNQFINWPQFEEKIETPKVNVRRFNNENYEPQISFEEDEDFSNTHHKQEKSISFNINEITEDANEKFTLNQRRPTAFVRTELTEFSETEEWPETTHSKKKVYSQVRSIITTENSTHIEQHEVTIEALENPNSNGENLYNSPIKQRRPTGYARKDEYYVTFNDDDDDESEEEYKENLSSNRRTHVEIEEVPSPKVKFEDSGFSTWAESETEKFTLNQRRPTGFVRPEDVWNDISLQEDCEDFTKSQVKFDKSTDFKDEQEIWNTDIKQRRPTGYIKKLEEIDLSDEESNKPLSTIRERRATGFNREISLEDGQEIKHNEKTEEMPLNNTVRFQEMAKGLRDYENNPESLIKQRRPTGYVRTEEIDNLEQQVNFQLNEEEDKDNTDKENESIKQRRPTGFSRKDDITKEVNFQIKQNSDEETKFGNEELRQRRPTGFIRTQELNKQVNFQLNQDSDNEKLEFGNELLRQRRPTGYVKKNLDFLADPPPQYHPSEEDNNTDFDNNLWQEMEKDVEQDVDHNIEEEFAKIRHSYEINEADFLELKEELLKSPVNNSQQTLDFGNSISVQNINKPQLQSPQDIKITFSDNDFASTTTSILKEPKNEEDIQAKPRKSKVTFDFKTNERVIPARKIHNDSEYESDNDDDVYDKPPPPIPPQPMQRMTNINYNTESPLTPIVPIPTKISLFGTQISQEEDENDRWSAIRKHRNLTVELQNVSTNSKLESPPPPFNTPPPKPSYRNPMAQLAIQRAKEARADLEGFKSRSINDKKPEALKRQRQQFLNLNNDAHGGTDA
ncbi:uncharacterized protein ACRADG_002597 [Cochliomyia hominivorax]